MPAEPSGAVDSPPDVEMVLDRKAAIVEGGLVMDDRHVPVPDGEWIRWLRAVTKLPDLFVYRHAEHGAFVLCQWINRDPPACVEIECRDVNPQDRPLMWFPNEEAAWRRLRGAEETRQRILRKMDRRNQMKRKLLEDHGRERDDAVRFMRSKGLDREADEVGRGATPWEGKVKGGDELEHVESELRFMSKITR